MGLVLNTIYRQEENPRSRPHNDFQVYINLIFICYRLFCMSPYTLQTQLLRDDLDPVSVKASFVSIQRSRSSFDYVPIAIQNKSNVLHLSIGQLLLELDAHLFETFTRFLDVVNGAIESKGAVSLPSQNIYLLYDLHRNVTEASTGVLIAVGIALEIRIILGAVVVGQLEDAFPVESVLGLLLGRETFFLLLRESQEVQSLSDGAALMRLSRAEKRRLTKSPPECWSRSSMPKISW